MASPVELSFSCVQGYLTEIVPFSVTKDRTQALIEKYDLENRDTSIFENLVVKPVSTLVAQVSANITVFIYNVENGIKDANIHPMEVLEITTQSLKVRRDTQYSFSNEELENLKYFEETLTGYLPDIFSQNFITSLQTAIEELKTSFGMPGSMPSNTQNVDEVLTYIAKTTKANVVKPTETLKDYICPKLLKEELLEIKDFFENQTTYKTNEVYLPKGILFKGPPGTGKTYAARCIAGSVDCYFMSCTASSLQGMYIGSGAENIRNVFKGAKMLRDASKKGVIIFIDEIDSFGNRVEHTGGTGGEEDRTINQLLAEMSGFEDDENIMILAATNFAERLDEALLRSGRFSRQITIPLPEENERRGIIEYYFSKLTKTLPFEDTNYEEITYLTEGLTPADIKEIANESGILTIRHKLSKICLNDVNEAINKVITHNIRCEDTLDTYLVSAHEVGHVVAEIIYNKTYPIKVTSFSYGNAGGFTQSKKALKGLVSKKDIVNEIRVLLGGRAAECVLCGKITTGASNDLEKAKRLLKDYYQVYMFAPYKESELNQIIIDKIQELYQEICNTFKTNQKVNTLLKNLTDVLKKSRILYQKDIIAEATKIM